jgi:dGTPase
MDWRNLFIDKRPGDKTAGLAKDARSEYEKDFDRIVFSSSFRRLQDKTQVIPLPVSDFVHTRLTHSFEVSSVGRSLGKIVGSEIIKRNNLNDVINENDISNIAASASLAHDIGNPPFGHSGEDAIRNYFNNLEGNRFKSEINNEDKWADLVNFEGNANGFRLLTRNNMRAGGEIRLTYSTLASFIKYPAKANRDTNNVLTSGRISHKKFGYFISEKEIFEEIFSYLKIEKITPYSYLRHPLAFLVEAADDICYRIIDFEDGLRIKLVPFETGIEILKSIITDFDNNRFRSIEDERLQIGYLRAKVINELIRECSAIFLDNENDLLTGKFDRHLLDESKSISVLNEIEKISVEKIYNSENVLYIESAGFNVISGLLDMFIYAVNDLYVYGNKELRRKKPQSAILIKLLPRQYLNNGIPDDDVYLRILKVCEFISGMTDSYAVSLYRKLNGIDIPK